MTPQTAATQGFVVKGGYDNPNACIVIQNLRNWVIVSVGDNGFLRRWVIGVHQSLVPLQAARIAEGLYVREIHQPSL